MFICISSNWKPNIYCQIVAQLEYNPKSFSLAVLSYKQYVEANVES